MFEKRYREIHSKSYVDLPNVGFIKYFWILKHRFPFFHSNINVYFISSMVIT